jgi:hypothetical protein
MSFRKKSPEKDAICHAALQSFKGMESCPTDWPDDWETKRPALVRREATVYFLSSKSSGNSIVVKVFTNPAQKEKDSARLHAALVHYHRGSDFSKGYSVPKPFGLTPQYAAVIMQWVDKPTFHKLLYRDMLFPKARHEKIRRVAGWLRWFHSQSDVAAACIGDDQPIRRIVRKIRASSLSQSGEWHDDSLHQSLELAVKCSYLLRHVSISHALCHHDFKPTNVLLDDAHIIGIDFLAHRRAPVTHDICRFLIQLDLYRTFWGKSFALKRGSKINDFDVFLSAYGGNVTKIGDDEFLYLYFVSVLSRWSSLAIRWNNGKRAIQQRFHIFVIRSIARQLSAELEKRCARGFKKPLGEPRLQDAFQTDPKQ